MKGKHQQVGSTWISREEQRLVVGVEGPGKTYLSDKINFPSLRLGSFFIGLISMYSLLWW